MRSNSIQLSTRQLSYLPVCEFNQDLSVPLKWTLSMAPATRRFYPFQTLMYLDNFTLYLIKYTASELPPTQDLQQNKQHVKISLPQQKGKTNLNKIQIISLHAENVVLVGFTNTFFLYRWTTGALISEFTLPGNQQEIQWISNPEKLSRNCSYLTVNTSSQLYILKVEHKMDIDIQFTAFERSSLFKSITSFFKTQSSSLIDSKSFTFSVRNSSQIFSLVVKNSTWSLYRFDSIELTVTKQWEREIIKPSNSSVIDVILEPLLNQNIPLVAYALVNKNNESIQLLRVSIDLSDGKSTELSRQIGFSEHGFLQMTTHSNKLYITNNNYFNKSSVLYIFDINKQFHLQKHEPVPENIVLGDNIIITQSKIYNYLDESVDRLDLVRKSESFRSGEYYRSNKLNRQSVSMMKQVQRKSKPSQRLESILSYQQSDYEIIKKEIEGQIADLRDILNKGLSPTDEKWIIECFQQLIFKYIQLLIASDLSKDRYLKAALSQYFKPRHLQQFFQSTQQVENVLTEIARSDMFLYFLNLVQKSLQKMEEYGHIQHFNDAKKQIVDKILTIIFDSIVEKSYQLSGQERTKLDQIMQDTGDYYDRYLESVYFFHDYQLYYKLCSKYNFDGGVIKLYVETDYLQQKQLKQYIANKASQGFIEDLTIEYFQYIGSKRVSKLKLLIDLPEHTAEIHKIIQNRYPLYSWLTALDLEYPTEYFESRLANIVASHPLNQKTLLGLQNNEGNNQDLDVRIAIADVCDKLGWNCMSREEFVHVLKSKSKQDKDEIKAKLEKQAIDFEKFVEKIVNINNLQD